MFMVLVVIAGRGKMADDIPHFPKVKVDRSLVTSYTAVSHSFWLESKTNTSGKSIISSLSSAQLRAPARRWMLR